MRFGASVEVATRHAKYEWPGQNPNQAILMPRNKCRLPRLWRAPEAYISGVLPGQMLLHFDIVTVSAYYADFATPFHVPLLHRSAVG